MQCLGGAGGGCPMCHTTWADRPRSAPQERSPFGEAEALVPQGLSLFQRDCANSNPGVPLRDELGPNLRGALCTLIVVTSCRLPRQCLKSRGEACLPASYAQQLAPTPPCLRICLDECSGAWILQHAAAFRGSGSVPDPGLRAMHRGNKTGEHCPPSSQSRLILFRVGHRSHPGQLRNG